jgi:peptide/nickel transport system permease protein
MGNANLRRFVLRRFVAAVLLLVGVTLVTFLLTNLVPTNPVLSALGETGAADPAAVKAYRERTGLDDPLPIQYLTYMKNLLHGDLGTSRRTQLPVREELGEYAPASIEVALVASFLALSIGILAGTVAALYHDRLPDQAIRVVSLLGVSMPTFWLALVAFYVLSYKLGLFPGGDRLDPGMPPPPHVTGMYTVDAVFAGQWNVFWSAFTHLLLPALVLAAYAVSLLTRFSRSAVLDVLGNDFVRTARAKGLDERTIALRHVLRAALVPIVTVAGVMFGVLLSGTVFVESIFAFPGLGQYAYLSATSLDLPAIMGISLFVAALYITINFAVDLLYGVIDPRIRLS